MMIVMGGLGQVAGGCTWARFFLLKVGRRPPRPPRPAVAYRAGAAALPAGALALRQPPAGVRSAPGGGGPPASHTMPACSTLGGCWVPSSLPCCALCLPVALHQPAGEAGGGMLAHDGLAQSPAHAVYTAPMPRRLPRACRLQPRGRGVGVRAAQGARLGRRPGGGRGGHQLQVGFR